MQLYWRGSMSRRLIHTQARSSAGRFLFYSDYTYRYSGWDDNDYTKYTKLDSEVNSTYIPFAEGAKIAQSLILLDEEIEEFLSE